MIKKWRKKRAGKWVAEDRLRAAMFGAIYLIPLSLALFGIANTYIDGTPGLVACLVCLFLNGIGVSSESFATEWGSNQPALGGVPGTGENLTSRWCLHDFINPGGSRLAAHCRVQRGRCART